MELLGDVGHVESCFFCLEIVLVSMVPLGDEAQVEARFGLSDIVLILTQDRCMVYIERTMGSNISFGRPRCNS